MRAVVTVVGKDKTGIISRVSTFLAEKGVNILDISQTILEDYFAMIMIVDVSKACRPCGRKSGYGRKDRNVCARSARRYF